MTSTVLDGPHVQPATAAPAISVRGLGKTYGGRAAVDGLSFDVPSGMVSGFVGPNGAGKTTTIRMLLGLVRPTGGRASVFGMPVAAPAAYLHRVGALIEGPTFHPALSGRQNLRVLARLGGQSDARVGEVLDVVGLAERASDRYRSYSLGMKQRLGIAAALLPDPELLVLDEPTNGLDPAGIREVRDLLRGLADGGTTVFVSSHLLAEIEQVCDHLVVVRAGRLVFAGGTDELLDARRDLLLATPERSGDAAPLVALATAAGFPATRDGDAVRVYAPAAWAGELNRRAMRSGITLVGLVALRPSLEEAFFRLTEADGRRTGEAVA
ncbi:MAG TPA: ABC transporter ATP-binding protein [Frankiaceae bacterium]|nr:ABC transporter ATP-binding protein [Frankiaceae bacterium]